MTAAFIETITRHYLESGDFNGTSVRTLTSSEDEQRQIARDLIVAGLVSINLGDRHPNPHIKAFSAEPPEEQLKKLETADLTHACLYPTPQHLATIVSVASYSGRPFTLRLALGDAQLDYRAFDLRVLEHYRNDPRYLYETDDIQGHTSVRDKYFESREMAEHDQILLEDFGFGYDKDFNRCVIVFLRYLANLSPEHQQVWNTQFLTGTFHPHPDFWASAMGHWPEHVSIFQAFTEELHQIGEMSKLMGREPLFRNSYRESAKPKTFGFLVRPTSRELQEFVLLLDKMISDNIDPKFFKNEVAMEREETRPDGKIVVQPKGTIAALEEWLKKTVRFPDPKPVDEMIATFRKIRKLRQKPAHAIDDNQFDQSYFKEQRALMVEAYTAVRAMRLILGNHPKAKSHRVPDWLYEGKIRDF
jgi:hypothetical protein